MDTSGADERLPRVAATLLLAVGGLALLSSVAVFFVSLPSGIVGSLPANYRVLLAVLAVLGGVAHLLAGLWARQRRPIFRIAAATLVGMVLLQVSAPVDILVLVILGVSRNQFEDDGW
jgi:succinate-acetate transporter protein